MKMSQNSSCYVLKKRVTRKNRNPAFYIFLFGVEVRFVFKSNFYKEAAVCRCFSK